MEGKIINEDLEKTVKEKVDEYAKVASAKVDEYMKTATANVDLAKKETLKTKEETIKSIQEKPIEWVAGAFVAGLILGKLLSK